MVRRRVLLGMLLAVCVALAAVAANGVKIHFFWAANCPHCAEARPNLKELVARYPGVELVEYEVWGDRAAFARLLQLAEARGQTLVSTPAIVLGERLWFGFSPGTLGEIEQELERCLRVGCRDPLRAPPDPAAAELSPERPGETLELPLFGPIDPAELSLPLFTLVIGLLDGFNPCAFFVLLFLLSLLTHAHSRRRMLLVGGTFVCCSGLIYFLFMAAWLNLFLLAGSLSGITLAAGLVAVTVAAINIKDFFCFGAGVSLSIPERAKPGLFGRMRLLVYAAKLPAVLAGTVLLAVSANAYELLCTAGFPMVYTRILTLHRLEPWQHYLYLLAYNLFYVLPLLTIVLVFTLTLGAKKLSERQGRILKLVSGMMMLLLGLALQLAPEQLASPLFAALLLGLALALSALVVWLHDGFAGGRGGGSCRPRG